MQVDRLQHAVVIVVGNVDAILELPVVDGVPRGDDQGSEVPRPPGSPRATAGQDQKSNLETDSRGHLMANPDV